MTKEIEDVLKNQQDYINKLRIDTKELYEENRKSLLISLEKAEKENNVIAYIKARDEIKTSEKKYKDTMEQLSYMSLTNLESSYRKGINSYLEQYPTKTFCPWSLS